MINPFRQTIYDKTMISFVMLCDKLKSDVIFFKNNVDSYHGHRLGEEEDDSSISIKLITSWFQSTHSTMGILRFVNYTTIHRPFIAQTLLQPDAPVPYRKRKYSNT